MENLNIVNHPLIQYKLSMLRCDETGNKEFRELVEEIAMLLFYEATREEPLIDIEIKTPLGKTMGKTLDNRKYAIVPILRAGIGMAEGVLQLMPTAKVGHIGLYRDPETLLPVEYYCKLPSDISQREVFLLDPMLATGGTSIAAVQFLKDRGVKSIKILCLISSPEGIANFCKEHPDVAIYTAANDTGLNEKGYILPGLGDAGDRLYGTK